MGANHTITCPNCGTTYQKESSTKNGTFTALCPKSGCRQANYVKVSDWVWTSVEKR